MSQIANIYEAIQGMPVSIESEVVTVRNLSVHDGQIHTTPVRILAPLTTNDDGRTLQAMTFGNRATITWRITDLMLLASVTEGSSIAYHVPRLVEYMSNFVDAFIALDRNLGLKNVVIESVDNLEIGDYEYPIGSGDWYHGCLTSWRVRENL